MTPDQVFQFCNTLSMFTWILLIVVPGWKWTSRLVIGISVTLLAIFYTFYISQALTFEDFGKFGSLEGLMSLFSDPIAVLAGWIHYLAFDLMVGWFIVFDAERKRIRHILIVPCLLLSFMMGPVGLLLYLTIRFLMRRKYFVDF